MVTVRLMVDVTGDALRAERLTRRLREHLDGYSGLDAALQATPPEPVRDGAKGASDTLTVVLTGAVSAGPVLVAAMKAWFERNRHNKVVVERNGIRIELDGQSAARQEQLLERVLRTEQGSRHDGLLSDERP